MTDQPAPEPPRAHNVAALDKLIKQISGAILADMERRKWCVEQAIKLLCEGKQITLAIDNPPPLPPDTPGLKFGHGIIPGREHPTIRMAAMLTEYFYDFITKPATDAAEKPKE